MLTEQNGGQKNETLRNNKKPNITY